MAQDKTGTSETLTLDEFPPHSYEEWREAAEKPLKGALFEKLLISTTYEGLNLDPIYRKEDIAGLAHLASPPGLGNQHRGSNAAGYRQTPWLVSQETEWPDPASFNQRIRRETELGLTELNIPTEGPRGLKLDTLGDMDTAFDQLDWRKLSFNLQSTRHALPLAATLVAYFQKQHLPLNTAKGCINNDPLGHLAGQGELPFSLETAYEEMTEVTKFAGENCPQVKTIGVSGLPYANGGASSSQELGYVLATALEYLRELRERSVPYDISANRIRMTLSIGPNFFLEIAKLRAARILWTQLLKHLGVNPETHKLFLHCRTGLINKTLYDSHVNLLRTTTEALSAILGNTDSLDIAPFDELNPQGGNLARRIARNIHTILGEECDLRGVIDAGGGSYYLEWLTDKIAGQAWGVFQSVEKAGGMGKTLMEGLPQAACSEKAGERRGNVSTRKERLVGTNMYPNAREKTLAKLAPPLGTNRRKTTNEADAKNAHTLLNKRKNRFDASVEAASQGATIERIAAALHLFDEGKTNVEAIPVRRLADDYESLRLAAERHEASTGSKPAILQLNLGPSRRYRARADWTSSFFQVGGFEVQNERDFTDSHAAIEAVLAEKPAVAVITSDDASYEAEVPLLAKALKEVHPDLHLMLAGNPGANEANWKEAGVDDFVHVRTNNYEMLKSIQTILGILS